MTSTVETRSNRRSLIALLVVAVGAYRLLVWQVWMRHVDKSGDEGFYLRGGQLISRWVRGRVEFERTLDVLVGKGWFMPGMAIHTWPGRQFLASGSLTIEEIGNMRLLVGVFDFVLLCLIGLVAAKVFNRWVGVALFAFIGFFPETAFASFTFWGESHGSKVLLLGLLGVTSLAKNERRIDARTLALVAIVGTLLAWAIYIRPPFLLQVGTAVVTLLVVALGRSAPPRTMTAPGADHGRSHRMVAVVGTVAIPIIVMAFVLPWSRAISERSGAFVLTTNTVDVNLIHAFSEPDELRAMAGGVEFDDIHEYAVARSAATGDGYAVVLADMRDELLAGITFGHWLESADREVTRFYSEDESFLRQYEAQIRTSPSAEAPGNVRSHFEWIRFVNDIFWYPLAVVTVLAMFWRFPLWTGHAFPAITAKIAISALAIQPWVSNAKFRHLGAITPVMALFALLALAYAFRNVTSILPRPETVAEERRRESTMWSTWARWSSTAIQGIAALMTGAALLVYLT